MSVTTDLRKVTAKMDRDIVGILKTLDVRDKEHYWKCHGQIWGLTIAKQMVKEIIKREETTWPLEQESESDIYA